MNDLFLNLLRTSLVVGTVSLILTLLAPLWNRRYAALWKKRLWCLLAVLALFGAFLQLPEGTAKVEVTVPERQIVVTRGTNAGGSRVSVIDPETTPAWENIQPVLGGGTSKSAALPAHTEEAPSVSLLTAGEILWALGTAAFLLRLAVGELLFRRRLRRWAKPPQSETLTALYTRLRGDTQKAHFPKLMICPGIGSPMLAGLFRSVLLLPSEDYSETETVYILRHELTHWHSRDLFWKLLLLFANAVHWFNPAVWLLRREAGREIERACDERVMEGADASERRAYGAMLLSAAQKGRSPALSTYFSGGKRAMKKRLRSILEGKKRRGTVLAAAAALLAVCAVPLVSCTQKTSVERNDAVLEEYFQAHYGEEDDGCVYADLTHDGLDELVVVELWKDAARKEPVSVRDAQAAEEFQSGTVTVLRAKNGKAVSAVWSGDMNTAREGEYHLYRQDQKDYLLYYSPDQSADSADYRYRLFSLDADGRERVTAQDEVACPAYDPADDSLTADDLVQRENPAFLHTASAYLQRATPLLCFDGEGAGLGTGWAAYSGLYIKFDAAAGDPADAPEAVRAMAEAAMEKQAQHWNEQPEMDWATGEALPSTVKIVDSELCALYPVGEAALPDKDGSVEVWKVRYLLKPENPEGVPLTGGDSLEGGWVTSTQDMGEPLLCVAAGDDGSYSLLSTGYTGTVMESMQGSYSFYASELMRKYDGFRAETVSFAPNFPVDSEEYPFRLETLGGASCYIPEGWETLDPVRTSFLEGYAETGLWRAPDRDGLAVYILHDRENPAGEETARTALEHACLSSAEHMGTLKYSKESGNQETSGGLVQEVDAVCSDSAGESVWSAYTISDGGDGCWAVVTCCPRVEKDTPDESWVWCTAITFCPDAGSDGQEDWQAAQLSVKEGIPYIRYRSDADWMQLGEAIAPPREWKDDHLAGRDTAKTLSGDPEISVGLVTAQCGWLVATYGRGVAAADTYVYRTEDGGKTWAETPTAPCTPWHLAATDFIDPQRAMVAGRNFNGAPVFYTEDGGTTWREETLPFSTEPYWEAASFRNAADSVDLMAAYGTVDIARAVYDLKSGTWETAYQVSLRDNGGTTDVLLEQGGKTSAVCTLRPGQDYQKPEDISLVPFDGTLGQNGFRLDLYSNNFGWRQSRYYAVRDTAAGGGAVQIADSFGADPDSSDFSADLDGDGIAELVCNDTYNADGVQRVRIFRSAGNEAVEAADIDEEYLATALDTDVQNFSSPVSSVYDLGTGKITFQYTVGTGDNLQSHEEILPLKEEALEYRPYQP